MRPGRGAGAPATRSRAAQGTGWLYRIAALLLFAVATAALPVQAQDPAHCTSDSREIWCATLTVEEEDGDYGFVAGAFGSLDPDYFSYNGAFPDVYSLYYSSGESPPVLILEIDAALGDGDGFELILGSVRLSLDDTFNEGKGYFAVENPGLSWSDGATVAVRLLAPATNTAPTASNGSVVMDEDTEYAFQESDFDFSDMDTGATLASVKVQTLPASGKGTLKFDGTGIVAADLPKTVTKAELDANKLVYSPPADAFGSAFGSFTFKVNDGTDDSASAYTMTIDVNEVSDRPVVVNFIPNQTAMVGATFSFQFADDVFKNGKVGPLTYSSRQYDGPALPSWLSFAPGTRTFSGMPQSSDVDTVAVTVIATNDVGLSASDTFDLVVNSNPVISGTARVGQTLTGSTGSSFTHQWIRVDGMTETNISGASSSTYTLDAADSGKKVKVKVSFTANSVTTEATSDAYPPYANIQPATCGTASLAGRRQVWEGTLTVAAHVGGLRTDSVGYGWWSKTGDLTGLDDAIDLGANSYRIGSFVLRYDGSGSVEGLMAPPPGSLVFSLIGSDDRRDSNEATQELVAAEKAALRLHVCGRSFDFSAATVLQWGYYEWQDADLIWEEGDSIPLKLSVPTSFMQVAVDPPTVDDTPGVSGEGSDGTWTVGETVGVTVTFSEAVDVDKSGGTPYIGIELGGSSTAARRATYASGSGTTELTFDYTLVQDDGSHSLMAVTPNSLALNGGTIRSAESQVNAQLGHNGAVVQGRSTRDTRPSASFRNVPESHDGTTAFTVGLGFSGAPDGLSAKRDAASVLEVTGGTVTGARATSKGSSPAWEVTVAPRGGGGDIMIEVPVRPCTEANAVCIGGQPLSAAAEATVAGPPMTARFTQARSAHDGSSSFDLHLEFSHEPAAGFSYRTVEGALLDIEGGRIARVWRRERGKNRRWGITLTPDGDGAVTVAARATTDCAAQHAVCDAAGRKLAGTLRLTVPGPQNLPVVSISAVGTPVAEGAAAAFRLIRTGGTADTLTVAVSVTETGNMLDGTPPASVTFGAGSAEAALSVPTDDDETDEDASTVTAAVSAGEDYEVDATSASADVVVEDDDSPPLTAAFLSVPPEHDGSTLFTVELRFSEEPEGLSYRTVRDSLFTVTGATLVKARRFEPPSNRRFELSLEPLGDSAVTLESRTLPACGQAGAVCTADGRSRSGALELTVAGPAGLSVADAEVEEGPEATLSFVVSLDRTRHAQVTVDYATGDGTATAGYDYTSATGTLTIPAGSSRATVEVRVLDDQIDDDEETLTLTLSNAAGARLTVAVATGTIRNSDPLPRALLARFGRAAALHVVEQVEERVQARREAGVEARFAGIALQRGVERDVGLDLLRQLGGLAGSRPFGAGGGPDPFGGVGGPYPSGAAGGAPLAGSAPPLTAGFGVGGSLGPGGTGSARVADGLGLSGIRPWRGDGVTGSAVELRRQTRRGGIFSVWSRGAQSHFAGREGELTLDGQVRTTMLGADYASGPVVGGLSLAHSWGAGGYGGLALGEVSTSVTGLYPWLGYRATERVSVWGVTGYGRGALRLTPEAGPALETGLSMAMAAAGLRGDLTGSGGSGFALAFKADALWVVTGSEAVEGEGGRLAAAAAGVTRARTALEASRGYVLGGGLSLSPIVEVGLRRDGGDAETGAGVDVGGGLVVSAPRSGLSLDVRVRTLLAHQAEGFRERGVSVSFGFDPTPSMPVGFAARVVPSWGGPATGGAQALWGRGTMADLGGGGFASGNSLSAEAGYGLPVGRRLVGTPTLGIGTSAFGRDYRLGYSLSVLQGDVLDFEFGVDVHRRDIPGLGETSHHALGRAQSEMVGVGHEISGSQNGVELPGILVRDRRRRCERVGSSGRAAGDGGLTGCPAAGKP